jgi:molybdenum cofactor synthesis domain-containing protein
MSDSVEIKIVSVNVSKEKGTVKKAVDFIELNENGIVGDAHAGDWHRQVSLLGIESVQEWEKLAKRKIEFGEFAENITTDGLTLFHTSPGDRFENEDIVLEVTQIGKKCHGDNCAIYREVGNCVMPKQGIFCRVLKGAKLKAGDVLRYEPKIYKATVITLSDRASKGVYDDLSGPQVCAKLEEFFNKGHKHFSIENKVIPDNKELLNQLIDEAVNSDYDIIITTGGTGIGPRDITVDVVKSKLDKEIPGIMEMIRVKYGSDKPNALLSRAVAGLIGNTLVYTLPGSVKAVTEYLDEIVKTIDHLFFMLNGIDNH